MDIFYEVGDFFRRLFMGRVHGAQLGVQSKIAGLNARARSKVANAVNQAIDSRIERVQEKIVPKKKP